MCQLCGGSHDLALVERPAHRLAGLFWEGSPEMAAEGAIVPLMARVGAASLASPGLWRSPLVCLTWSVGDDDIRHFVGFSPDEGAADPNGFEAIDLPRMEFATRWHSPQDGAVTQSYLRMFEMLPALARRWDSTGFHQREEYPPDTDPAAATSMRLMLPVAA
jgi:predicted transcriptional regulator YdeE